MTARKYPRDINELCGPDQNPLCVAARYGHFDVVNLLLKSRADMNRTEKGGATPLNVAAREGHRTIVELLIRERADLDVRDLKGATALHAAAQWGHKAVVKELLYAGAAVKFESKEEKENGKNAGAEKRLAAPKSKAANKVEKVQKVLTSTAPKEFPAVNIAPFVNPENFDDAAREKAAKAWDQIFRKDGFALIEGHGVSEEVIEGLRSACRKFFTQNDGQKVEFAKTQNPASRGDREGYSAVGSAFGLDHETDPVEGYTFMSREAEQWVTSGHHPPDLVVQVDRYYKEVLRVMHTIHRMSAEALGLPQSFFEEYYAPPANVLVLSHYPPLTKLKTREGKLRYRAHSDYTGFTILLQDDDDNDGTSGGLEIDVDGAWVPVKPKKGCFVINIGDLFEMWTNGRWRSTPHRVTSPKLSTQCASRSRYSVMLFSGPSMDAVIEPIHTCVDKANPPLVRRMRAYDHLMAQCLTKSKEATYAPG